MFAFEKLFSPESTEVFILLILTNKSPLISESNGHFDNINKFCNDKIFWLDHEFQRK